MQSLLTLTDDRDLTLTNDGQFVQRDLALSAKQTKCAHLNQQAKPNVHFCHKRYGKVRFHFEWKRAGPSLVDGVFEDVRRVSDLDERRLTGARCVLHRHELGT